MSRKSSTNFAAHELMMILRNARSLKVVKNETKDSTLIVSFQKRIEKAEPRVEIEYSTKNTNGPQGRIVNTCKQRELAIIV